LISKKTVRGSLAFATKPHTETHNQFIFSSNTMNSYFVTASGVTVETSGSVVVYPQGYSQCYQVPVNYNYNTAHAVHIPNSAMTSSCIRQDSVSSVATAKTYDNASAPSLDDLPSR
jgi:hypothetical protein